MKKSKQQKQRRAKPVTLRQKAKVVGLNSVQRPLGAARKKEISELNPEALFLGDTGDDPLYDAALIGAVQKPCSAYVACYDFDKCVECLLQANPEWSREDALEWMDFNVVGAYVGENGPVFFHQPIM
jgi:hypothetical protein